MREFLKTTVIGGVVFLVPVAILLAALGHVMALVVNAIQPIASDLHVDRLGKVAGFGMVTILAVLLLILISFVAGLVARTRLGKHISGWFENSFFDNFPKYQTFKSMAQGFEQLGGADHGMKPALVSTEGGWQIGYLLEPLDNDWVAVFVPHAPTPMAGTIKYFPVDRVRPLDIPMSQLTEIVKNIGVGSRAALRGANLGAADQASTRPRRNDSSELATTGSSESGTG
jgi:uncharacterized membrane protein